MAKASPVASEEVGTFSLIDFALTFITGLLLFGGTPIAIVLVLNYLNWTIVALAVSGLAALFIIFLSLGIRLTSHGELHKKNAQGQLDDELGFGAASFISLILLFSLVCKEVDMNYPGQFSGTEGSDLSLWSWCLYSVDNFFECIFFDVPSIYNLHLTDISPIAGLSRFVAISFRITVDFLLIASIIHHVEFLKSKGKPAAAALNPEHESIA